jgi:hypothetical protein
MAEITKQALQVSNNTSFPNNNAGAITPSDLRAFNVDMIDSLVDEIGYNVDSASWNRSINALNTFTSSQQPSFTALNQFTASQLVINSGVNVFTQSADARLDALESETLNLELFTSSVNQIADNGVVQGTSTRLHFYGLVSASIVPNVNGAIASINIEQDGTKLNSASFNSYTASNDTKWDNITAQSGSWITESESGSFLVTASVNLNTITFTKGNNTTFAITVNTGSGGATTDITALNAFTASQDTKNSTLANVTASLNASSASQQSQINNLIAATGSYITTPLTSLNQFTASQDTKNSTLASVTASLQQQLTNIGGQSGSWITESETASFARTNVDNNFTANQTFTNITAVSASFTYVQTTYETSSVIYSSGSNIFGDSITDVQTLNGQTKVSGSLGVTGSFYNNGLIYPTTDNGELSFIQSDGAGNLSLQYVKTLYQNIRNRETSSIVLGTPLFVSGATGDNADVYIAQAGNPLRFPATLIAGDATLAASATGKGIVSGEIKGPDTSAYTPGTLIYLGALGGWTSTRPTGSTTQVQILGVVTKQGINGEGLVMNQLGTELPNIQEGYTWVGNVNATPVATPTSSFGTPIDLTSLNAFTQSQDTKNTTLENVTASLQSYTASQQLLNGTFATTGSNIFYGDQIVTASAGFYSSNDTAQKLRLGGASNGQNFDFRVTGSGVEQQIWLIENQGGVWGNSFFNRMYVDSNLNVNSTFTASLQEGYAWVGNNLGKTSLVATSSFGSVINTGSFATTGSNVFTGDQILIDAAGNSVTLSDVSGSLMLVAKTFTSASTHLTSSAGTFVNLIFKDNNNTADTIISGSGNIFTNPTAPTATFKRLIGGSNNIYTSNAIPQISSSMQFPVNMNRNIGNFPVILRGPVSSSSWNLTDNVQVSSTVNIGNTTSANDKMVSGFSYVGNGFFGGILNVSANSTTLTTAPLVNSNLIFGATVNLNNNSSSLSYNSNIQNGGITINNNYITASGAGIQFRNVAANINTVYGVNHRIEYGGTNTSNTIYRAATANLFAGTYITASLEGTGDNTSMLAVCLMGNGLIVSGTSTGTTSLASPATNATYGSVISGRYNAVDGNRAKTAETIFAVGTGTAYANRKTGFLIDSGSNTFVEGTFNVSGSTAVTGAVSITQTMQLAPLDPLPAGTIGMLAVSASNELYFYNGAWTLII